MDRRRYIPSSLGTDLTLEARQLMAANPGTTLMGAARATAAAVPVDVSANLAQRFRRIDNLPFILQSVDPNRKLPASVIGPIQDDLRAIISTIQSPPSQTLREFNKTIRSVKPNDTLSPGHARDLLNAFNAVLRDAGTDPALRQKFVSDMTDLARQESLGPEPTIEAINDFAIITQLVIAVGQPFQAPGVPRLLPADSVAKSATTRNRMPKLVGVAAAGTVVQLVETRTGEVLASGTVPSHGSYTIQALRPLAEGSYTVRAQTVEGRFVSLLSRPYTFKVVATPLPRGPRG